MTIAFSLALALHIAFSVIVARNKPEEPGQRPSKSVLFFNTIMSTALLVLACRMAYNHGVFTRQLVSPVYIAIGLVSGHFIFTLSLLVTHKSVSDAMTHFTRVPEMNKFVIDHPIVLSRFASVGIGEEIIWRGAAQLMLIDMIGAGTRNATVVILVVAFFFAIVHKHFLKNSLLTSTEFLCFAIFLGVLYYLTGSLILVIIIHAVRDIEVAFLEYLIMVDELGDEEAASEKLQKSYLRHRVERI